MNDTFPMRIKELRSSLCKTQSDFADFIGTTQSALSGYENGERTPSYEVLIAISQKCNVSLDWLCGLSDTMTLDNHIDTYKDIFRLFVTVLDARYENKENIPIIDTIDTETSSVTLTLHKDQNFQDFFSKWRDIFKLHCEGTIDDDLYQMWIKKQLNWYNRPIDECPF